MSRIQRDYDTDQRRQWHPTPVLLPGKSHGWTSLVGCSLWGHWESDMTEQLCFHFSFSCIGEENGNPLQCSCLENPKDGGAWWATIYGVAQSQTWLKRLSSSSSMILIRWLLFVLWPEKDCLCKISSLNWYQCDKNMSTRWISYGKIIICRRNNNFKRHYSWRLEH